MRAPAVTLTEEMEDTSNLSGSGPYNKTLADPKFYNYEEIDVPADGSLILRTIISVVYSVVCAVGLVGNLLVIFLVRLRQGRKKSSINFFVINLAITDFQFVLALPFWAVDMALDYSWPFGDAMCKIILSVTVMNMYASVFFLTAMSITRYWSVASSLRDRTRHKTFSVKRVCAVLWMLATLATAPTTIFATVKTIAGEKLCLIKFPDKQIWWLAIYHLQKILIAFVVPMLIVSACYLMLLRFIRKRSMKNNHSGRRSKVTKSVTIVVMSFFFCWMPNHAITFWGVLVKLNAVNWDSAYYIVHTYVFPVTICLANVNSCLNPVLYCLMRREFRKMLKNLFWRMSSPDISTASKLRKHHSTRALRREHAEGVSLPTILNANDCHLSIIDRQFSLVCYKTQEAPSCNALQSETCESAQ